MNVYNMYIYMNVNVIVTDQWHPIKSNQIQESSPALQYNSAV